MAHSWAARPLQVTVSQRQLILRNEHAPYCKSQSLICIHRYSHHHSSTSYHIIKSIKGSRNTAQVMQTDFPIYSQSLLFIIPFFVWLLFAAGRRFFFTRAWPSSRANVLFISDAQTEKLPEEINQFACVRLHFSALRSNDPCDERTARAMTPPTWSHAKANWLIIYVPVHPSPGAATLISLSGHTYIMHAPANTLEIRDASLRPLSAHCKLCVLKWGWDEAVC
jgi:hypothetical protein